MLALRWEDWDGRGGLMIDESVSILPDGSFEHNDPKTATGRRRVPLLPEAEATLREHHRRFLEDRMLHGRRGEISRLLIFPRADDPEGLTPYSRHALYSRWTRRIARAGLPPMSLYALRHTATMLYASAGTTDLKTTQGVMGHSDPITTLRYYTHFVEERAVEATKNVGDMLGPRPAERPGEGAGGMA